MCMLCCLQLLYDMVVSDDQVDKEYLNYLATHTPVSDSGSLVQRRLEGDGHLHSRPHAKQWAGYHVQYAATCP
jgi:hypothetical protein